MCTPFFTTMRPANLALTLATSLSDLGTHPAQEGEQIPTVRLRSSKWPARGHCSSFAVARIEAGDLTSPTDLQAKHQDFTLLNLWPT